MVYLKNKLWTLCGLLLVSYCWIESAGQGDLYIYLSAASDLSDQQNIFENKYVDGYHYYYSVFFALLLKPLCFVPFRAVKFFWLLLNGILYMDLFRRLANSSWLKNLSQKQNAIFLIAVFLFSFRFLLDNIHASQITILILWCCIVGLRHIFHNKAFSGSLLLALGINIKLLPIVLIPYLLYRGYFKSVLLIVIFYFSLMFLPSLFIGHSYNLTLLKSWANLINPANQIHVLDVEERSFHSLTTLLSTLLVENVPDPYALNLPRNIADISSVALAKVILIVRLALVMFTLYFIRSLPFQKAKNETQLLFETSYSLLLIPLIFPHQQHYAFLFAVPAFALGLYFLLKEYNNISRTTKISVTVLLSVIYLLSNLKLLLGVFNTYYEHYKILTYGALLLIPLLAWIWREEVKKRNNLSAKTFVA